jgi:peptide chain release factor 2
LEQDLKILESKSLDPKIWDNQDIAQQVFAQKSAIENKIKKYNNIKETFDNCYEYFHLLQEENDESIIKDLNNQISQLQDDVANLEIESIFNQKNDTNNCFLDINAGAGGADSCDFSSILMRMYHRFCDNHNFKVEIISLIDSEEAGIRSATLKISGIYAYGWLKTESGVHRLVRLSPFNANNKRQTSFASIWVYPEIDDDIEIEINEKDLRIDTYRASGAGGQHVNKTDSAVRITHLPTNIVVQCQSDRSQIKNRSSAIKMLKSRLYELELKKKQDEADKIESGKTDNSWGHQIRSYVMHPYQMVKDLRSSYESSNIQAVFDGEIDGFIKSNLQLKI